MVRSWALLLCFVVTTRVKPQTIAPHDVVINEILFNPKSGGSDYIELYNRSDRPIDLAALYLSNKNSSGNYGVLKKLCDTVQYLMPSGYAVFTENADNLGLYYFVKNPDAVIVVASLPSYPNAEGNVVLLTKQEVVIDDVPYKEDWQFPLLASAEGVALERVDPDASSNDKSNWRSAASDAGYGTPGYQNSNYQLFEKPILHLTITPHVFSPDGDGIDDVATIEYTTPENGYVANVFIYDAMGRQVRHLVKNAMLGTVGHFTWNGLDEKAQRLPVGQYIVYTELFNLQGKKKHFKNVIVLARRLN